MSDVYPKRHGASFDQAYAMSREQLKAGQLEVAETLLLELERHDPVHPDVIGNLGIVYLLQNRYADAARYCNRAMHCAPDDPRHAINLASALLHTLGPEPAVELLRKVCVIHPESVMAHYNLGCFLRDSQQCEAAEAAFRAALTLDPLHEGAALNLAQTLSERGMEYEQEALLRAMLQKQPDNPRALGQIAVIMDGRGEHAAAAALYRRVLSGLTDPGLVQGVRYNLSCTLFCQGQFAEAFALYESRWEGSPTLRGAYRYTPERQWRGEPLAGRLLWVWGEQGLGDHLAFARFLPALKNRGAKRLTLALRPELVRLFRQSFSALDIVALSALPPELDEHACHCPLMSVPLALAAPGPVSGGALSAPIPYLRADPGEVAYWRARVAALESRPGLRIGLAWRAGAGAREHAKSFDLALAQVFANLPGIRFFRLSRLESYRRPEATPPGLDLVDLTADLTDMAVTAALIECLDAVITVDTSVLHLAAALGKPVLALAGSSASMFLAPGDAQSPWYPNVQVWRQPVRGDWRSLLVRAADTLRQGHWPPRPQDRPADGAQRTSARLPS